MGTVTVTPPGHLTGKGRQTELERIREYKVRGREGGEKQGKKVGETDYKEVQ